MGDICVLQFTGGRDSTLTALELIEKYHMNTLRLITFKTDLMVETEAVYKNVNKLQEYFKGTVTIQHDFVDTNLLLKKLVQNNYFRELIKYKTYNAATFCPSCRLSHHANTILFCLKNGIRDSADGVNELTGFDLFQQGWAVDTVRKLYKEYGITYHTPLLHNEVSSEILLEEYNKKKKLEIPFFESQPKCIGGGQFHNLYLRCYYLPIKGKQSYIDISKQWIDSKITFVKMYIEENAKEFAI